MYECEALDIYQSLDLKILKALESLCSFTRSGIDINGFDDLMQDLSQSERSALVHLDLVESDILPEFTTTTTGCTVAPLNSFMIRPTDLGLQVNRLRRQTEKHLAAALAVPRR